MMTSSLSSLPLAILIATALSVPIGSPSATAQTFNSGSNGSLGDINVTVSPTTTFLTADGRLHYDTVTVAAGGTWGFRANALNTPVYILAQGDVVIEGTIDVAGAPAPNPAAGGAPTGGVGGPGGFDGGKPGFSGGIEPGAGYGPAGGLGGRNDTTPQGAGAGSFGGLYSGAPGQDNRGGPVYGNPVLVPIIGGSGGGGTIGSPGVGGGGGGGALVIASSTQIILNGTIRATGGDIVGSAYNMGSGGAVRLIAPVVRGTGSINVRGGNNRADNHGRVRVDTFDRSRLQIQTQPALAMTAGANLFVVPPVQPSLHIVAVADNVIPQGATEPVTIQLPFGADTNQTLTVRAIDFNAPIQLEVVLTPDSGAPWTLFQRLE